MNKQNNSSVYKLGRKLVAFIVLAGMTLNAQATSLKDMSFNSLPGGKVEIRLDFDGTPPDPKAYTVEKPARIALDLKDVNSALSQKKYTLDMGNAQSVVVVEAGGRTRVIVNMIELSAYNTRIDNQSLFISLGGDAVAAKPAPAAQSNSAASAVAKAASSDSASQVNAIDFRRGEDGEGKLIINLSNAGVDVDARVEGSLIKVTFSDTDLPANLARRYDVSDFATPVQRVDARREAGKTTFEIKPSGQYDYLAYQANNTYVLSVKPLTPEEVEAKKNEFAYIGDKLTLNFQDIDVRAVLQLIADFTDLNLVASDTVSGKITLRLQNVPWDQALDLILKTKGLDKRQEGNVLMVAPAAEIAERERLEIETNKQIEELAPLQSEFIRIKYANAKEIFTLFESDSEGEGDDSSSQSTGSILSPRGSVIVDERTNSLLVTETAQKLEELRRLIALIDVPVRQVMVEARIVIATSESTEKLGIAWGGLGGSGSTVDAQGNLTSNGPVYTGNSTAFVDRINGDPVNISSAMAVDLGVTDQGATSMLLGYVRDNRILALELSAIEANGTGEIVSQPKVITGDKQEAVIKSGTQIPYLESSASGGTTVSFKDAVLKLQVTPNITPDNRVIMDLEINQDSLGSFISGENNSQIPIIDTNQLTTQVLIGNGETVVLGGVFRTEDLESVTKTPFLGDIPYLGRLFRTTSVRQVKTETLIFITPRILADKLVD